jgi:hypothetical protein
VVNESSGNVNILGIRMDHDGGPVHASTTRSWSRPPAGLCATSRPPWRLTGGGSSPVPARRGRFSPPATP